MNYSIYIYIQTERVRERERTLGERKIQGNELQYIHIHKNRAREIERTECRGKRDTGK